MAATLASTQPLLQASSASAVTTFVQQGSDQEVINMTVVTVLPTSTTSSVTTITKLMVDMATLDEQKPLPVINDSMQSPAITKLIQHGKFSADELVEYSLPVVPNPSGMALIHCLPVEVSQNS